MVDLLADTEPILSRPRAISQRQGRQPVCHKDFRALDGESKEKNEFADFNLKQLSMASVSL